MNQVKLPSIVVIFFCAVLCALALSVTQAEVPKLINYQGKLTTPEGAPVDTTVSMQFSIYSDSTGGDPLWSETQMSVRVDKGIFNVLLGSVNEIPESVFTGAIRYLGVKVSDDPEMMPRRPIVSVPYAQKSAHADTATYLGVWPPAGKVYDSGWFSADRASTYVLTHNLNTTKLIAQLWFSTSQDGSDAIAVGLLHYDINSGGGRTASIQYVTPTSLTIRTGWHHAAGWYYDLGYIRWYDSGYYRLILLALE
jgi:hypothetical protein